MIEVVRDVVDSALLYFHTRCSSGNEITPFLDEIRKQLRGLEYLRRDGVTPDERAAEPLEHAARFTGFGLVFRLAQRLLNNRIEATKCQKFPNTNKCSFL